VATNVLHPLLLLRLVAALVVAALVLAGARVAWQVLARWHVGQASEGQLVLERRAELVATLVQGALGATVAGLALTVLTADRLAPSIRGAMCAYGVFGSTETGFVALATSAVSAATCTLWVVLHRLDLRLATPALTRRKFMFLLWISPVVLADLVAQLRFVLELDFSVVASCCSTSLDGAAAVVTHAASSGARTLAGGLALTAALGAAGAALVTRRAPSALAAWTVGALSLVAAAAAMPAVLWVVAPYTYESPHHLCPFCLLRAEAAGLGWPLFAALFAGTVLGSALALVESQKRAAGAAVEGAAMQRGLAGWAAGAWLLAVALAATPVVRYLLRSGGASLFGDHG
jgi:hypothetical protein